MTQQQLNDRHDIINQAWQLLKKYQDVKDTDAYWEALVRDGTAICQIHPGKFAREIVIAVCNDLERLRGNGNDTH